MQLQCRKPVFLQFLNDGGTKKLGPFLDAAFCWIHSSPPVGAATLWRLWVPHCCTGTSLPCRPGRLPSGWAVHKAGCMATLGLITRPCSLSNDLEMLKDAQTKYLDHNLPCHCMRDVLDKARQCAEDLQIHHPGITYQERSPFLSNILPLLPCVVTIQHSVDFCQSRKTRMRTVKTKKNSGCVPSEIIL